ncbi:hypothetical protein D6D27_09796 [Aureobasidium pullulans]|nr:hypothetical protein D6D27_09796 [Aureobasidium pullulans]
MDEEETSAFMEEWLTARLGLSKPDPCHNSGDRYAQCTPVPAEVSWLPKNLDRISGVVHEILTFFDVELTQPDKDNYTIYIFCIFTVCVVECEIQADGHNAELKEHYKKKYAWRFDDSEMDKHVVLRSFLVEWDSDYFEDGDDGFRFDTKDDDHRFDSKKLVDDGTSINTVN